MSSLATSWMCDFPSIRSFTTRSLTSYPITRKPACANSSASGSPTYPSPTTPMTAVRLSSFSSRCCFMLIAIELSHCFDDFVELPGGQLGVDRQRDHFFRSLLALGKRALGVAEVLETWLQVQRQRVIHRVADSLRLEMGLEVITPGNADRVLVIDRHVRGVDHRSTYVRRARERRIVVLGVSAPARTPGLEMRKLGEKNSRLKRIEPAVVSDLVMKVGLHPAVHAKAPQAPRYLLVLRHHHPTVAVSAEVLGWKEAERSDCRGFPRTRRGAGDGTCRADRLSSVLDDRHSRNRCRNRVDGSDLPEQVDRNDGLRARGDRSCSRLRRDVESLRIDVRKHRTRSDVVNRAGRRKKRERRGDDLVSVFHIERTQREQQRIRTVGAADCKTGIR